MESARFTLSLRMLNGNMFNFDRPQDAVYDIELVAEMLGKKCRFGDHIRHHFSVAEHCVNAARLYPRNPKGALMHDSPEFIVDDVVTPLKRRFTGFDEIEDRVATDMEKRFNFIMPDKGTFKLVDTLLFHQEEAALYDDVDPIYNIEIPIECWEPKKAAQAFLDAYYSFPSERYTPTFQDFPGNCL